MVFNLLINIIGLMEENILDIGVKVNNMVKGYLLQEIRENKENGNKVIVKDG